MTKITDTSSTPSTPRSHQEECVDQTDPQEYKKIDKTVAVCTLNHIISFVTKPIIRLFSVIVKNPIATLCSVAIGILTVLGICIAFPNLLLAIFVAIPLGVVVTVALFIFLLLFPKVVCCVLNQCEFSRTTQPFVHKQIKYKNYFNTNYSNTNKSFDINWGNNKTNKIFYNKNFTNNFNNNSTKTNYTKISGGGFYENNF